MKKKMTATLMTLLMLIASVAFAQDYNFYKTYTEYERNQNNKPSFGTDLNTNIRRPSATKITTPYFKSSTDFSPSYRSSDSPYSFECIQKRQNAECEDNLFQYRAIDNLNPIFKAVVDTSPAACFNAKKDKCDLTPDIRSVCGCLARRGAKGFNVPDRTHTENTNSNIFSADEDIVHEEKRKLTSKLIYQSFSEYKRLKCDDPERRDKVGCEKLNKKVEEYREQYKASAKNGKQVAGSNPETPVSNDNVPVDNKYVPETEKQFNNSCMSFEDFNKDYEIPSKNVRTFFNSSNGGNDSQSRARLAIMTSFMKGETAYGYSISDETIDQVVSSLDIRDKDKEAEKARIKQEVDGLLKSPAFTNVIRNEIKTFAVNNSHWAELIKKDPAGSIKEFKAIYKNEDPAKLNELMKDFKKREDVVAAKRDVDNRRAELLNRIFNEKDGLIKKDPAALYLNYDLVSAKFDQENRTASPAFCSSVSNMMSAPKSRNTDYSDPVQAAMINSAARVSNEETVDSCNKTYSEICQYVGNTPVAELEPDEKEAFTEYLTYIKEQKNALDNRRIAFDKFSEEICGDNKKSHKMNKSLGGKSLNREEFKNELCVKQDKKFKKQVPADIALSDVCADTPKGAMLLTSIYTKSIDEKEAKELDLEGVISSYQGSDPKEIEEKESRDAIISSLDNNSESYNDKSESCGFICNLIDGANKTSSGNNNVANAEVVNKGTTVGTSFGEQFASGLTKAAETISQPAIDNNVQSFLNGTMPSSNILPASFANADAGQINGAKNSVDNGIAQLEKRIENYEKQEGNKNSSGQNEELEMLRKQIAELKQQSENLRVQLEKEKDNKVAQKGSEDPANIPGGRSPASVDYKSGIPQVSGATQTAGGQNVQPSKVYDNMFGDGSFHNVPTIGSSKSIDSKAFSSRTSNDALLSIYTDKSVSSLVDAVASNSSSNILVVGNALEMQESTVKDKKFLTKELVIDQTRLEQVRSNPESLRSLIEENKIKNHVGILTLKTGDNQLNYIMRKDDAGKIVILPLNIARRVTLDSLKNELISN